MTAGEFVGRDAPTDPRTFDGLRIVGLDSDQHSPEEVSLFTVTF